MASWAAGRPVRPLCRLCCCCTSLVCCVTACQAGSATPPAPSWQRTPDGSACCQQVRAVTLNWLPAHQAIQVRAPPRRPSLASSCQAVCLPWPHLLRPTLASPAAVMCRPHACALPLLAAAAATEGCCRHPVCPLVRSCARAANPAAASPAGGLATGSHHGEVQARQGAQGHAQAQEQQRCQPCQQAEQEWAARCVHGANGVRGGSMACPHGGWKVLGVHDLLCCHPSRLTRRLSLHSRRACR